jgi:hypothetical protein
MIKYLYITFLLLVDMVIADFNLQAQTKMAGKPDNLQQQKIAFFNEKLQLTPVESAKFWPVYNDYQNRRDRIIHDRTTLMQYFESNKTNMAESEAGELIAKYLTFQHEETNLLESYTRKFQEFLPAKKVMKIYIVELDFKKWLLENLRQNKIQSVPRN